ncbi:hypothetical protein CEXT_68011 [Caerostris extrusa]|uniref:Uncharacterized protein n=1 Tax=Caerostris extrusa TaxID=172846 RepID=A0AAV4VT35_CAEEX|nr:hypothetical protein CEXT_68011 [Caerostris extrusa]
MAVRSAPLMKRETPADNAALRQTPPSESPPKKHNGHVYIFLLVTSNLLRTTVGSAPDSNSIDRPLPRHHYRRSRPVWELFTKRDLFTPDADPFLPDHSTRFSGNSFSGQIQSAGMC